MTTPSKYHAKPVLLDGFRFHSHKEARRWQELRLLSSAGFISDLARQVPFPLVVNETLVTVYIADFTYVVTPAGALALRTAPGPVVEDTKGFPTPSYRLKAKLFKALHGFAISEV
jgi:hypothetical protein